MAASTRGEVEAPPLNTRAVTDLMCPTREALTGDDDGRTDAATPLRATADATHIATDPSRATSTGARYRRVEPRRVRLP